MTKIYIIIILQLLFFKDINLVKRIVLFIGRLVKKPLNLIEDKAKKLDKSINKNLFSFLKKLKKKINN